MPKRGNLLIPSRRHALSPYLLTLLAPIFWSGNAVIARALAGEISPLSLAFWRWVVALLVLAPIGLPRILGDWHRIRRQGWLLLALAVTSVSLYNTLFYLALTTTTAISATLVGSCMPVIILGLSRLWLNERISVQQIIGMALSLAGVLTVIARGQPSVLLELEFHTGDVLMLAATLTWAIYSVLLRRHPTGLDPWALLTLQVAIGLACLIPPYAWEITQQAAPVLSWRLAASVVYMGVFASVLAYYFWNRGVQILGATITSQYSYFIPLFTAALAVMLLGESFHWYHGAGLALIFSGVWIVTFLGAAPVKETVAPYGRD